MIDKVTTTENSMQQQLILESKNLVKTIIRK